MAKPPWNTPAGREWLDLRTPLTISTPSRRREAWSDLLAAAAVAPTRAGVAATLGIDRATLRHWLVVANALPELAPELAHLALPAPRPRPPARPARPLAASAPWWGQSAQALVRERAPRTPEARQRAVWLRLLRGAYAESASLWDVGAHLGISRRTAARWSAWLRDSATRVTHCRRGA